MRQFKTAPPPRNGGGCYVTKLVRMDTYIHAHIYRHDVVHTYHDSVLVAARDMRSVFSITLKGGTHSLTSRLDTSSFK